MKTNEKSGPAENKTTQQPLDSEPTIAQKPGQKAEPEPKPDPELVEKLVYESLGRLLEVIGTQIEIDHIKNKEESNES